MNADTLLTALIEEALTGYNQRTDNLAKRSRLSALAKLLSDASSRAYMENAPDDGETFARFAARVVRIKNTYT